MCHRGIGGDSGHDLEDGDDGGSLLHCGPLRVGRTGLASPAYDGALFLELEVLLPAMADGLNGQLGRLALVCLHLGDWSQ